MTETTDLYDVVAVNLKTFKERIMSDNPMTLPNAEAFINMAIARRGLDEEIYKEVPHAKA
jgi:hypothetical protein